MAWSWCGADQDIYCRHEAEFYGIAPLVKRLILCQDLHHSSCGDVLFCGYLPPPSKFLQPFFYFLLQAAGLFVPLSTPELYETYL